MVKNPVFHGRTKHIGIRYHFVREHVKKKNVEIVYCPSKEMIADMLTKGLSQVKFETLRELLMYSELLINILFILMFD